MYENLLYAEIHRRFSGYLGLMSQGNDIYSVRGTFVYSPSTFADDTPSPWCCIKNIPEIMIFVGREVSEGQKIDLAPVWCKVVFYYVAG